MKPAAVITSHVINTLNALPAEERAAITSALASELLLGETILNESLTPMQHMIYSMIRSYVTRDTARFTAESSGEAPNANDPFCARSVAI